MTGRSYRVHEFAERAGVTVKALQHYDRVGLLKPARSASRYRLYMDKDLERLEQIVALKLIGLSLRQIRQVLDREAMPLTDALRLQRDVLLDRRERLDRAIAAIEKVQQGIGQHAASDAAILQQLITVVAMQDDVDVMKKYFSDEAWEKWRPRYFQEPSPEIDKLFQDGRRLLDADPGSEEAQTLYRRWTEYWIDATNRDPDILHGMMRAWVDRENWPAAVQDKARLHEHEALMLFFGEVAWERMARSCENSSSRFTFPHRAAESRIRFYQEVEHALDEGPRSARGRELAARWNAILDAEAAGDADTRAAIVNAWSSRRNWPPMMRRWVAGHYMMTEQRWEQVNTFLEHATALSAARFG